MFRIVERRYWFFLLSTLILVPGLISIFMFGLPLSIDFTGGSVYQVQFDDPSGVTESGLREAYVVVGISDPQVVEATDPETGELRHQIRSQDISPELKTALGAEMRDRYGEFTELQFESVGASVGAEVAQKAAIAVLLAAIGIMIYLTVVFANVPHPVRYGVAAVIAMLHDVILVLGLASLMGHFFGWEIDALFLTALLTVLAFSVHDSIVVFDRIRENVARIRGVAYETVVNHSIIQTLDRSINTQMTALFTLTAIFIYSQGQLKHFVFWLIIGLVSGTYSSIFNASPLLVVWENREWRTWFGRGEKAAA